MRRIDIDFAPAGLARHLSAGGPAAQLALIAGLTLLAFGLGAADTLLAQRDALRDALEQLQSRVQARAARHAAAPRPTLDATQTAAVNHAIAQLNLPWSELFDAVEQALPRGVALLELRPDAGRRTLKGQAETRTAETMLAAIRALETQGFFGKVVLTHHEINDQDPNRPLRFEFEAVWAGEAQ